MAFLALSRSRLSVALGEAPVKLKVKSSCLLSWCGGMNVLAASACLPLPLSPPRHGAMLGIAIGAEVPCTHRTIATTWQCVQQMRRRTSAASLLLLAHHRRLVGQHLQLHLPAMSAVDCHSLACYKIFCILMCRMVHGCRRCMLQSASQIPHSTPCHRVIVTAART